METPPLGGSWSHGRAQQWQPVPATLSARAPGAGRSDGLRDRQRARSSKLTSVGSTGQLRGLWRSQALAGAPPRGHRGRPRPGRPADARARPRGGRAGQDPADDRPVRALPAPGRPRRAGVHGPRAQQALARRHHLRLDLVGLLLHGVRHRRLQPRDRGLAGVELTPGRARPRRARDGDLEPTVRRSRRPRPPQR